MTESKLNYESAIGQGLIIGLCLVLLVFGLVGTVLAQSYIMATCNSAYISAPDPGDDVYTCGDADGAWDPIEMNELVLCHAGDAVKCDEFLTRIGAAPVDSVASFPPPLATSEAMTLLGVVFLTFGIAHGFQFLRGFILNRI